MKNSNRRLPSKSAICNYWINNLNHIKQIADTCWGCGVAGGLHRCHIKARVNGGTDDVGNLILLCQHCHLKQETICTTDDGINKFVAKLKEGFIFRKSRLTGLQEQALIMFETKSKQTIDSIIEIDSVMFTNRVKGALADAKSNGKALGSPSNLSDYSRTKSIEVRRDKKEKDPNWLNAKKIILDLSKKSVNLNQIAKTLNSMGMKTRREKEFTATTVKRILKHIT